MGSFAETVEQLQPGFKNACKDPNLAAFVAAPDRVTEANAVEECVRRAVIGELDPTGRLAISRFPLTRFSIQGLAMYLEERERFDSVDREQLDAVAEAVRRVLALGWLYFCSPEAQFVPSRSDRSIWLVWAPGVKTGDLNELVDKELAERIRDEAGAILRGELRRLGVVGRRGRLRLEMIAGHLATLGATLRMLQTSEISNEIFEIRPGLLPQTREDPDDLGRWAWDAYPRPTGPV